MAKGRITGRGAEIAAMRRAGLDLCDAVIVDLCKRGLLTVTPEALDRLAEHERSLQSYKLMRFSRELAAMETRLRAALLRGAVDSSLFVTRLERLQFAARRLRALLDDPAADPLEIEEIAGHTWRDGDLERRENVWLAEMAWESVKTEEGFRVDTSYFAAPGGAAWCERKILPMNIHANIDDSLKPQQDLTLKITRKDGAVENVPVRCRIDTPIEIDYYQHGGILPFVLRQLIAKA